MAKPAVKTSKVVEGNWKVEGIPNHEKPMNVKIAGWPAGTSIEPVPVDEADAQDSSVSWLFGYSMKQTGNTTNVLNKVDPYTIELNTDLLLEQEEFVLYYKIKYFDGPSGQASGSYSGRNLTHVVHKIEALNLTNSRVTEKANNIYSVSLEWGDPAIGIR